MAIDPQAVQAGRSYTGKRWQGDRQVNRVMREVRGGKIEVVVHYVDLRTMRTGSALLEAFARAADGPGLARLP